MKGISRCEMNLLMTIPEAQQIIEAKFVELRLIFKDKIREKSGPELTSEEPEPSNIIPFPLPPGKKNRNKNKKSTGKGKTETAANNNINRKNSHDNNDNCGPTLIKIVDASGFRYTPEEEQVKIFMNYFKNHQLLRKAILDEFFLRILPYSNLMVK